jgi:hypothetical protein
LFVSVITDLNAPHGGVAHRQGTIYSDLTGKFVTESSQGNNYLLVVYDADSNHIFAEPIASRQASVILKAYQRIHQKLVDSGASPTMHVTDNEAAQPLIQYLKSQNVQFQLVPPDNHRANAAERAIRTFKNHFISILCSTDPEFPLHLWDRLLPQALLSLNLMRTSGRDPRKSAYEQIYGHYDFNKTPIGPPGTAVIIHDRPKNRGSWAPHGTKGWYIGQALSHNRSFTVYIPSTSAIRITDTIAWFPTKLAVPSISPSDIAIAAAQDLTHALLQVDTTSSQRDSLRLLATLFKDLVHPTTNSLMLDVTTTLPMDEAQFNSAHEPRVVIPTEPRVSITTDELAPTQLDPPLEPRVPSTKAVTFSEHIEIVTALPIRFNHINHNGPQRRRRHRKQQLLQQQSTSKIPVPPPITATASTVAPVGTRGRGKKKGPN